MGVQPQFISPRRSQLLIRKYIINIDVTWLVLWAWEYVSPLLKTPILAKPLRMCWKNGEIRVQRRPNTACPCWNSIAKNSKRKREEKEKTLICILFLLVTTFIKAKSRFCLVFNAFKLEAPKSTIVTNHQKISCSASLLSWKLNWESQSFHKRQFKKAHGKIWSMWW